MNTIIERIAELNETCLIDMTADNVNYREAYQNIETEMANTMKNLLLNTTVTCRTGDEGTVIETVGTTFDTIVAVISFRDFTKRYSLALIMTNKFIKFADEQLLDVWTQFNAVHTKLNTKFKELEAIARQASIEASKKAEADKKAADKYEQLKAKAISDFDKLSNRQKEHSDETEFYWALGWLAKHIGTISATMPDYLSDAFKKYFGEDAVHKVVDSKKKTSNGNSMQWTWSFRASVKKVDSIPSCIASHFNDSGKAITDTAFIWDLVDNYGFSFGKSQNVENIAQTIPAKYIDSFNEGLTA